MRRDVALIGIAIVVGLVLGLLWAGAPEPKLQDSVILYDRGRSTCVLLRIDADKLVAKPVPCPKEK